MHITLVFLGDVNQQAIEEVAEAVRVVGAQHRSFEVELFGVGAFPDRENPVTLWAGIRGGLSILEGLQRDVVGALVPLGFEPEQRRYSAHLTLGRLLDESRTSEVRPAIEPLGGAGFGQMSICRIGLYSSQMSTVGPQYELLEEILLAPSAPR